MPDDEARYKSIIEKKRVFIFFTGLIGQLDDVKSRIFARKSLTKLREAFSEVRHEESRRKLMGLSSSASSSIEGSALVSHRNSSSEFVENPSPNSGQSYP